MRLTIVQYAGDYRESYNRFRSGGRQTYQAQRYSVGMVGEIASSVAKVAVLCAITAEPYDEMLPNGVRAIGGGFQQGFQLDRLLPLLELTRPTHLWIATPLPPLIRWALNNKIPSIAVLADSFNKRGLKEWVKKKQLAMLLNQRGIRWVANHGLSACASLRNAGVNPGKIIPWDWPATSTPSDFPVRDCPTSSQLTVLYVGSVSEAKGVGDLLRAAVQLRAEGAPINFRIIGNDVGDAMKRQSVALGVSDTVCFVGPVPNEDIIGEMRASDLVIVPSRHEYPEGMPLTIYEALCARTPLIASDHPMFRRVLVDGETAQIFKSGDPQDMARAIRGLMGNPSLYRKLSENALGAWQRLQVPVRWGDLLKAWAADDAAGEEWISHYRLNAGNYDI